MSRTEKYEIAWERYLTTCRRYEIEVTLDFIEFVKRLSPEQVDMMLQNEHSPTYRMRA
ncbi:MULTISPECIES: hypothetical protein [Aneurinibacillus]|jgi:hypothetical protein|uniref:Uncharacterized protein n=1 Tax=Aneurinibacillus danicus TaxID=267746 RepID=A0A511V9W5_9BACL|nr:MULTISPECIES: hypothetical protein [Aneurinibacillus]GEN35715.1 hypothetical protein ADA01nite_31750 [Aneurinibacillus danicus]